MSPFESAAGWWGEGQGSWVWGYAVESYRRLAAEAELAVEAQYAAAEAALAPFLVSPRGRALGVDARDLWRMPRRQAEELASEELLE